MDTNLIGISGYIGSGKDLFAKMIQLVIYENVYKNKPDYKRPPLTKETLNNLDKISKLYKRDWEVKKFATPLKQIACILLGCTMEQLEDQEFKKRTLSREWNYYIKFEGDTKVICDKKYIDDKPFHYTVREFLQKLGTEAIRNQIHDNAWVNAMFKDYNEIDLKDMTSESWNVELVRRRLETQLNKSKWIISDLRFPNEAKAIKDRGGICVRINRNEGLPNPIGFNKHKSETALDNYDFDYTIFNNGSLEELYNIAKNLVEILKLS